HEVTRRETAWASGPRRYAPRSSRSISPSARSLARATRTEFSLIEKSAPAATRARTGMAPRRSVDRRSRTRVRAVVAATGHYYGHGQHHVKWCNVGDRPSDRRAVAQRRRRLGEALLGRWPVDAAVGDRHPVGEVLAAAGQRLVPGTQVALEHEAHDGGSPGAHLPHHVGQHLRLLAV